MPPTARVPRSVARIEEDPVGRRVAIGRDDSHAHAEHVGEALVAESDLFRNAVAGRHPGFDEIGRPLEGRRRFAGKRVVNRHEAPDARLRRVTPHPQYEGAASRRLLCSKHGAAQPCALPSAEHRDGCIGERPKSPA